MRERECERVCVRESVFASERVCLGERVCERDRERESVCVWERVGDVWRAGGARGGQDKRVYFRVQQGIWA